MKLIVIHRNRGFSLNGGKQAILQGEAKSGPRNLLRFVACTEPLSGIIFSCLNGNSNNRSNNEVMAIPQEWQGQSAKADSSIIYYEQNLPVPPKVTGRPNTNPWFIVSNGRFATQIDHQWLHKILAQLPADVAAVNVLPQLQAGQEKVLTASQSKLVGFRRFYRDWVRSTPIPDVWPQHLFIKTDILNKLLPDDALPLAFSEFINNCSLNSLTVRSLNIGGTVFDLETEQGLLSFITTGLNSSVKNCLNLNNSSYRKIAAKDNITIFPTARLFGNVLFGQNVSIGQNAIIAGPIILGNNVKIAQGAVIRSSIIGPGVCVPQNHIVQNQVLIDSMPRQRHHRRSPNLKVLYKSPRSNNFRTWPKFSYAGCLKRIADIVAAITVLILFAPVSLVIALVIKLTSRGPVFFKDPRQGLHGKVFNCLKFRTMLVGADKIQDKLRILNQADGPQFKMPDDPRLSAVGKFLRDTYIDEIPQFFNVLLGQMSVIGPRPSPEVENSLCPPWRDARLSVRPGITGLWQVCRTRQPMKDFQEWIHYDIKYVRNLSLKTDLWICWQTAKKMAGNFVSQF